MKAFVISVCIYGFVALVTFGYAASEVRDCSGKAVSVSECKAVNGMMAGMMWPLYWSWAIFDEVKK